MYIVHTPYIIPMITYIMYITCEYYKWAVACWAHNCTYVDMYMYV